MRAATVPSVAVTVVAQLADAGVVVTAAGLAGELAGALLAALLFVVVAEPQLASEPTITSTGRSRPSRRLLPEMTVLGGVTAPSL